MQHIGAFVVRMFAIRPLLRNIGQCPPTFVKQMRLVHHLAVVRSDLAQITIAAVHIFKEKKAQEFRETFVQVHLFRALAGDKVAEPFVRQLVRHRLFESEVAVDDRRGVVDAGGMFHRAHRSGDVADLVPAVMPEKILEMFKCLRQVDQ